MGLTTQEVRPLEQSITLSPDGHVTVTSYDLQGRAFVENPLRPSGRWDSLIGLGL
jgi:hypothetical protein